MKAICASVLLYLAVVNSYETPDTSNSRGLDEEKFFESIRKARELGAGELRHRRGKTWYPNYGYNAPHYYSEDRRDYDQDTVSQILKLLDEITDYVRRPPPPPPQPIYVPYPVPYPVPQYCSCGGAQLPNVTIRFPEIDDANRNWGFVDEESNSGGGKDDDKIGSGDGSRPISFDPIKPIRPVATRPRPVEHGSSQAGVTMPLTSRKEFTTNPIPGSAKRTPTQCDGAILSCCGFSRSITQQRRCFSKLECGSTYDNGNACSQSSIASVLELYKEAYAAVN